MNGANPSTFLFPLSMLSGKATQDVAIALERLQGIFAKSQERAPPAAHGVVYGFSCSARIVQSTINSPAKCVANSPEQELVADSGYASAEDEDEDTRFIAGCTADNEESQHTLSSIQNDSFERDFTVRWLTGFISRSSVWVYSDSDETSNDEAEERERLIELAASLLSSFAGADEEEEALTRQFEFLLGEGNGSGRTSLSVELNDAPLSSADHSSVGLQSWASSIVFARLLCNNPSSFGLKDGRTQKLRVLELGAGTGLLSIITAKLLAGYHGAHAPAPEVVATDSHPDVLSNLRLNVETNSLAFRDSVAISVVKFDWEHPSILEPFNEEFDVILAADVIYNSSHATWISNCVSRLLRRPSDSSPGGCFWLAIPIRTTGRHEGMDTTVTNVFPAGDSSQLPSARLVLKTFSMQELPRCEGVGRADETGYRLFKICWA